MKKIVALVLGLFLISRPAFSANDPAVDFVSRLANDMISDVLATEKPMTEKLDLFRSKFQNALDLKYIGQFVTGVYWRRASDTEKQMFLDAFMEFATKSWADKFNMYTGQTIVFKGTRNAQKGQLFVDSVIQNEPPAEVIWRIREKDGSYKIVDIIVEGVSMAMSYRNEYNAYLQANGGSLKKLTQTLKVKSDSFKFSDEKK